MSAYIKKLIHDAERDEAEELAARLARDAAARRDREVAARDRLSPLEDRLARLLATIPLEVQRAGAFPACPAGGPPRPLAGESAIRESWEPSCGNLVSHVFESGVERMDFRRCGERPIDPVPPQPRLACFLNRLTP